MVKVQLSLLRLNDSSLNQSLPSPPPRLTGDPISKFRLEQKGEYLFSINSVTTVGLSVLSGPGRDGTEPG